MDEPRLEWGRDLPGEVAENGQRMKTGISYPPCF